MLAEVLPTWLRSSNSSLRIIFLLVSYISISPLAAASSSWRAGTRLFRYGRADIGTFYGLDPIFLMICDWPRAPIIFYKALSPVPFPSTSSPSSVLNCSCDISLGNAEPKASFFYYKVAIFLWLAYCLFLLAAIFFLEAAIISAFLSSLSSSMPAWRILIGETL